MTDIDIRQGIEKIGIFWFILSVLSALWASLRSCHTIVLHLKNYRRPDLQRLTIRILLMYAPFTLLQKAYRISGPI